MPELLADIGGTNARFALADSSGVHDEQTLSCSAFPGVVDAARSYLDTVKPEKVPDIASFAVAGPVAGDWFETTNQPWAFSIRETQERLCLKKLLLMNDFEAIALSIPYLKPDELSRISEGEVQKQKPVGIIGPGTGLGVASLFWDGTRYKAVSGEGGHVTMPARTQREFDVFQRLLEDKYSHVSAERVCSGKGLVNIYNALRALDGRDDLPDRAPEEISKAALDSDCSLCAEALDMMTVFLGVISGNLALTLGAHGGIYIAGGIVAQLGDGFDRQRFCDGFLSKGRFKGYVAEIPAFVVLHEFPAFLGLHASLMEDRSL